jgi:TonB family protein
VTQQANYTAPHPIKQVQPRWPPNVTPGPAQVQVRVSINAKGRVNKIALVGSTPSSPLMIEISKAASLWEFEPARVNGQPVPSEMSLIFRFR